MGMAVKIYWAACLRVLGSGERWGVTRWGTLHYRDHWEGGRLTFFWALRSVSYFFYVAEFCVEIPRWKGRLGEFMESVLWQQIRYVQGNAGCLQ